MLIGLHVSGYSEAIIRFYLAIVEPDNGL